MGKEDPEMIHQIKNVTWNRNMAKRLKRTKKKPANPTPRKSSGADSSIADEKRYSDERRSEKKCFGALNKNTHIA